MNRHYQELRRDLNKLREDARQMQRASSKPTTSSHGCNVDQVPLGIAILCMVGADHIYGHKMSIEMQAARRSAKAKISQLQESEALLERRIRANR